MPCPPRCSSCEGSGEITEELQKKAREIYRVRFANFTPASQVTRILIALNVIVYIADQVDRRVMPELALKYDVFSTHQYWEFLSANFLHANLLHLLLNMGFLWTYGQVSEGILGRNRYLGLYLASGIVGSVLSWLGNCYYGNQAWAGVGASGALFGLIGSLLALHWRWHMIGWAQIRPLVSTGGLILLGGFAAEMGGFRLLDNWGHLGGALAGLILTAAMPRPRGH